MARKPEIRYPGSDTVRVRPMSAADLDHVVAIEELSYRQPWFREQFQTEIDRANVSRCYVAEVGEEGGDDPQTPGGIIAGFLTAWFVVDEMHITNIAVHPGQRGKGVATALLRNALDEARTAGGRWCQLEVRVGNAAARALYSRLGFREAGLRRGYYSDGEDAIVMGRELE